MPDLNVSPWAVSICFSEDELPPPLDSASAKKIVSDALFDGGHSVWPDMEVEVFSGNGGVLLIARPLHGALRCFSFRDVEHMIAAALSLGGEPPSRLTYMEGQWLLSIRSGSDRDACALSEFGDRIEDYSDGNEEFLSEHGQVIIPQKAVSVLKRNFS